MEIIWNDAKITPIPDNDPVVVRQCHGVNSFGCHHTTECTSGIIKLNQKGDQFNWDGKTYLIKVTHWRDIMAEDLNGTVNQQQPTIS